jgi:hypothetical protein
VSSYQAHQDLDQICPQTSLIRRATRGDVESASPFRSFPREKLDREYLVVPRPGRRYCLLLCSHGPRGRPFPSTFVDTLVFSLGRWPTIFIKGIVLKARCVNDSIPRAQQEETEAVDHDCPHD